MGPRSSRGKLLISTPEAELEECDCFTGLPCCDHTNNVQCQSRCREVLRTLTVEEEIMDELINACGGPDLMVCFIVLKLWNSEFVNKIHSVL